MPSGADLEYEKMLVAAGQVSRAGMDGARLEQLADIRLAGAQPNSPDATLLARANHTGTQAVGTITGLAAVATSGSATDLVAGIIPDLRFAATSVAPEVNGSNLAINSTPVVDVGMWESSGALTRVQEGGVWWVVAPAATFTYFQATGVVGKFYSMTFRVKGTPGTTFNSNSSDFAVGSFTTVALYTIPASGYITVTEAATVSPSATGLRAGVTNPSAAIRITDAVVVEVAATGGRADALPSGVRASVVDTGWTQVAAIIGFQNSWTNYSGGEPLAVYRKVGNRVSLAGTIKSGTVGTAAFTLPYAYWPKYGCSFVVASNGALAIVYVGASGIVTVSAGSNSSLNLGQISYLTD